MIFEALEGVLGAIFMYRAGDGIRTHEYQLGRLTPYHLATPAWMTILPSSIHRSLVDLILSNFFCTDHKAIINATNPAPSKMMKR